MSLYTADALSHAPISERGDPDLDEEVQAFVGGVVQYSLPASKGRLEEYKQRSRIHRCPNYINTMKVSGQRKSLFLVLIPYYHVRNKLTVCNDLLAFNERIVVPKTFRTETL